MTNTNTETKATESIGPASLRGNFAWTTIGNAVYAACQWGMVSVLAKLGSPEVVGQYALGVAVSAPILMLAQLNLRTVLATDISGEHHFLDYRDVRVLSLVFALLGITALGFLEHSVQDRLAVVLVALAQAVEWIADIYLGLFQRYERMKRIAISLSLHGVLSLTALSIVIAITGRLVAGLLAVLMVRFLALLFYDSSIGARGCIEPRSSGQGTFWQRFDRGFRIVKIAFPLGVVLMIGSFAANVPRYFIAHMLERHSLGIFSAIASLTTGANLLVCALGQAATPRLATLYQEGDREGFRRMSVQLAGAGLILGACTVAGSIIAGRWVLALLFGHEYAAQSVVLLALASAAGLSFVASLLGYAITAGRRFNEQMPLQIAAVAGTSFACLALVPRIGLLGAALAVGFGFLVQIAGELWVLRSILQHARKSATLAIFEEPSFVEGVAQ
jgi:O-antigen/teichoic acid export membrane protein